MPATIHILDTEGKPAADRDPTDIPTLEAALTAWVRADDEQADEADEALRMAVLDLGMVRPDEAIQTIEGARLTTESWVVIVLEDGTEIEATNIPA